MRLQASKDAAKALESYVVIARELRLRISAGEMPSIAPKSAENCAECGLFNFCKISIFAETCHISAEIPVGVSVLYFRYTARNTASGTHEAFG
jgi:hypothetical protein